MLADEVRTGQLSAVCHFSPAPNSDADSRAGDGPSAGAHCDLCGALGWALPPLGAAPIACFAGCQVAAVDFSAVVAVATLGLPFSRGPSALLS